MLSKTLITASALLMSVGEVHAFWRMSCGTPLVTDQIDPLVQPGIVPGRHVHNFMGGSGLSATADWESLQSSDCTSCQVKGDKSLYWVPSLYFQRESDGKFLQVTQKPGMLVYYIPEYGGQKVEVFPKGFKMVAGDPHLRNFTDADRNTEEYRRQKAIGFNCLNYNAPPEAFAARSGMPTPSQMTQCPDGLRADIQFPSCWNGELDSHDHRSHMAYPTDVEDGQCPDSHPRRLITMKFETLFHVTDERFQVPGQFIWSTGDPTGYAYHGDFVNAWDMDLLEAAVKDESCVPPVRAADGGVINNCNTFTSRNQLQDFYTMNSCTIKPHAKGDFAGPAPKLSGCNPVRDGPAYALDCGAEEGTDVSNAKATSTLSSSSSFITTTRRRKTTTSKPAAVPTTTTASTTTTTTPPAPVTTTSSSQPTTTSSSETSAPVVTANPVLEAGNGQIVNIQAAAKEVVVTVVETKTLTVFDDPATKTVSVFQHRRRHQHRRGF